MLTHTCTCLHMVAKYVIQIRLHCCDFPLIGGETILLLFLVRQSTFLIGCVCPGVCRSTDLLVGLSMLLLFEEG